MTTETLTEAAAGGFAALQHAYGHRLDAARQAGGGVVGMVGNTVPLELVLATGRMPVLIAADMGQPTPVAEIYMEEVIAPETKSLFENAVGGAYEFVDLLVLTRNYAQLYYYLKDVYRLGRGPRIPPLHMFDLMQSQREAVRAYNWGRLGVLVERLERLSGQDITESGLRAAIALTNRRRALQRQLLEQRWRGALSGVDAMQALGAAYFLPPQTYVDALSVYLATLQPEPALVDRPRLLVVTSEPLSHVHLHQALESAGGLVVAEDDWWGSRGPGEDIPLAGSAREAIFRKYWLDTYTSAVYPAAAREAWFNQHALRSDVDGIVFYVPPSDHQFGWDYPRLAHWLTDHAKPSLLVRADAAQADGQATITTDASRFLGGLQAPGAFEKANNAP